MMNTPKPDDRPPRVEPESGVQIIDNRWHAVSLPFWLRLEPTESATRRRWIKLRYSSSFFDEPVRPLIRFFTAAGKTFIQPMNGATLGSAEWIGRVPDQTMSVWISPGRRLGPFSFRIERIDAVSRFELVRRGFFADPPQAAWAVQARLRQSYEEATQALKFAIGGTGFEHYGDWHARMTRMIDLGGFDRPTADWTTTPKFHLLMSLQNGSVHALQATLSSLQKQAYQQRWWLHAVATDHTPADVLATYREAMRRDARLVEVAPNGLSSFATDDRLALIEVGDSLQDYALAVAAERLASEPNLVVLYSDEDAIGHDGTLHSPTLKPDWGPAFHQAAPYVGRLTCVRYADIVACGATAQDFLLNESTVMGDVVARADRKDIGHIRRVLYRRLVDEPRGAVPGVAADRAIADEMVWPKVSVVIPTRDRADLLRACVKGLNEMTDYPAFDVVIVDNGSMQPEARALLDDLRANPRFKILERPGPFNYSKLSNDGARSTNAPMLVFLNNDIEMVDAGWLKALVRWARKPNIGGVGAKLLFPDGTIQHAGVVLGMGGIAGHVYRRSGADDPGYLHQLQVAREITAVTAACIAIERTKFEAVGGFDSDNLPVDLNDMDLCLRVAEHGWTNMWTPAAVLIHAQSATRGSENDSFGKYRRERDYFTQRWAEAIRDDSYYHPALELFEKRPALG